MAETRTTKQFDDPSFLLPHHFTSSTLNNNEYPVNAFPSILGNVITDLNDETQIPISLIGSTILAASALALQPLVEITPPYSSEPEPCSLYILSMARSGEGKSTLSRIIMKPFHDFSAMMKQEYDEEMIVYKKEHRIWNIRRKVLESEFAKAIKINDFEMEEYLLQEHLDSEIPKPKKISLIYEDATPKAIIEGLNDHPYAGIISDEAITFFTGYTKNNLGLLNKTWSGDSYILRRADEEDLEIKAYLTLSLMVQPMVFTKYLERHFDIAASSGFLSRFLFCHAKSTIGHRQDKSSSNVSIDTINELHAKFHNLLLCYKNMSDDNRVNKKTLVLSERAKSFFQTKYNEYQSYMIEGGKWSHMTSIGSKTGSNALRIAAILHEMNDESDTEVNYSTLRNAFSIVEWYLNQADDLFFPMSPQFLFIQDTYELFFWIKNHFEYPTKSKDICSLIYELSPYEPFPKRDIETSGPNRLRKVHKLNPILKQLIGLGLISIIKYRGDRCEYIALTRIDMFNTPRIDIRNSKEYEVITSRSNTIAQHYRYDLSKLKWDDVF